MTTPQRLKDSLAWLEREGSARVIEENLERYAIDAPTSYGVPMAKMQQLAKKLGTDRALADALWKTGWGEARSVAALVTAAQMERWAKDFETASLTLAKRLAESPSAAARWIGKDAVRDLARPAAKKRR